jgi:hypothetical protein
MDFKEIKEEVAELDIPDPGKRIRYCGHVIRVERVIPRVKPLRMHGVLRYGSIQIILPKDCVDKPAYVIVYVLSDKEKLSPSIESLEKNSERPVRSPLFKAI